MASAMAIYLQNHEAAAQAGRDLFRRAAANQRRRPYADELRALSDEVQQDLDSLRVLMAAARCRPNQLLGIGLRFGERIGRLKPNGRLVSRSALSDLIEVEALLDAVHAKRAGWVALAAAEPLTGIDRAALDELELRADLQISRLAAIHRNVAARVLPAPT